MNFVKMKPVGVAYADPQNPILKNLKRNLNQVIY